MTHRPHTDSPWWRRAVVYEVYPRSFADGDGDGEGDLAGLVGRIPYLAALGIDALWIAPWYPSPMADGGYDITDYFDLHPMFGTLADAQVLLGEAHAHDLKVIIDLVANHTSSEHPWFQAALGGSPGSDARQLYFFRDGRGEAGELPPNNWISAFGDSAWTRIIEKDGTPGQWYLHTFSPAQPDLNWRSSHVRQEFDRILRFWLDLGVDGFRIDAVPAMAKQPELPDAVYSADLRFDSAGWVGNPHWDVDDVHDILRRWRSLIDAYDGDRVFVAEAVVNGPERLARYLRPDELHTAFNFDFVHASWDAVALRRVIDSTLDALDPIGAPATWTLSNHDEVRHATRLGRNGLPALTGPVDRAETDHMLGMRRARAAVLLMLALPGGAYLYQGEELGLPEVEDLPDWALQDPVFRRSRGQVRGRDGCRVPLPWAGSRPPYGFSPPGVATWLPQPEGWHDFTAAAQERDPHSMLNLYKRALSLRRQLSELAGDDLTWQEAPAGVLRFRRGRFSCVLNLSGAPFQLEGRPLIVSAHVDDESQLPHDAAAWVT